MKTPTADKQIRIIYMDMFADSIACKYHYSVNTTDSGTDIIYMDTTATTLHTPFSYAASVEIG